jgi:ferredoxin
MATKEDKYKDNVKGKFYVDTECIDCNLCRETAPDNFADHEDGYSYVYKQPTEQGEADACS